MSQRLGITYEGIANKFLISFDLESETKRKLQTGEIDILSSTDQISEHYKKITVQIPATQETRSYYFKDEKLISPTHYFTQTWTCFNSSYFKFVISDTSIFHRESIRQLEDFVEQMLIQLEFLPHERLHLSNEKIVYVLCKNEEEIEQLTGYKSRGMFLLAYDYIITTYNCHFHELAHLLMNYKLRQLPLLTHPFLQEGFAVYFGGRGGIARSSLLQTAVFLSQSNFLEYPELLHANNSSGHDASLSYPLSGLYTSFLIQQRGMGAYLSLYRNYSVTENLDSAVIAKSDLPSEQEWKLFLDSAKTNASIFFTSPGLPSRRLFSNDAAILDVEGDYVHIRMKENFGLRPPEWNTHYQSKRYKELFPHREYEGEHFLFTADSTEVTIYDLYTNNSIAGYSAGFSLRQEKVPLAHGWYEFWVKKNIFHTPLEGLEFMKLPDK